MDVSPSHLPWGQKLPKMCYRTWVPIKENQWRPSWIFRKAKVPPNASLSFTRKPKTKSIFWIFSVAEYFLIFVCWTSPSHYGCHFFFLKTEKQILSLLEDVRDLVVLMTQQAYSMHVMPGDKMASWWCPQIKPVPTENHPFGPWSLFLCQVINSSSYPCIPFSVSMGCIW